MDRQSGHELIEVIRHSVFLHVELGNRLLQCAAFLVGQGRLDKPCKRASSIGSGAQPRKQVDELIKIGAAPFKRLAIALHEVAHARNLDGERPVRVSCCGDKVEPRSEPCLLSSKAERAPPQRLEQRQGVEQEKPAQRGGLDHLAPRSPRSTRRRAQSVRMSQSPAAAGSVSAISCTRG